MKKLLIVSMLLIGLSQANLQAALPPLYASKAEFKALIEDSRLTEKLQSGEAIVSISRAGKSFTVVTTRNKMFVDVVPHITQRVGPAEFHLEFHEPRPL
jgi:hypothetical protein